MDKPDIKFGSFACEIRTAQGGIYCRPYGSRTGQWERYRLDDGLEVFTGYCLDHHGELLSIIAQREQERIEEQDRAWLVRALSQQGRR